MTEFRSDSCAFVRICGEQESTDAKLSPLGAAGLLEQRPANVSGHSECLWGAGITELVLKAKQKYRE